MKRVKVSVIVLNYNGKKYLKDCFDSLRKTNYENFEVVMVDNMSTDDSVKYTKKNFKWVKIIEAGSNLGWAIANNIGIKSVNGKYVVLLNNDTICTPNWLEEIVKIMDSDKNVGVVGSWPVGEEYKSCNLDGFPFKHIQEASTVSGAAMMVRMELFKKIGLFENNYFIYWEDTEFTWRSILSGYKVFTNYDSIVYHINGGHTSKTESERWVFEKVKNRTHAHIKLMGWKYVTIFLFHEFLKTMFNLTMLPYDLYKKNPLRFRSYIRAYIWNIKNIKSTLNDRKLFKKVKVKNDSLLEKLITYDKYRMKRDYKFLDEKLNDGER